jgi:WD40 repeat protein
MALAISKDRKFVVTGSTGIEPMVFVWDAELAERKYFMTLPRGSRSVSAVAFSDDNTRVAVADMTDDYRVHIFELSAKSVKGKVPLLCSGKKDRKKVSMVRFYPGNSNKLISVSTDSIVTWEYVEE